MKKIAILTSLLIALTGIATHAEQMSPESGATYGAVIPVAGDIMPLKNAISSINNLKQIAQKISGTVNQVCRHRGCWMILTDGEHIARVTFKDYKFFVPTDSYNQRSIVYGVLTEHTLSEEMAKHYADDAGQSGETIRGPQKEYSIVAEGVYLENK